MAGHTPETVIAILERDNGVDSTRVAEILNDFADHPESDKDSARGLFAAKVFAVVFGERAQVRESEEYERQRQVPWSTNCWLQPEVIVSPTTSQQVAAALALCVFLRIHFSIRGGGHLHNPGSNSNNSGVVISLSAFKQVKLSDDKRKVDIGVGLRWLDVYSALDSHSLAVAGGRMPTVGVPGLILGGGISFQNSQYGVGAMGVVNFEVVLADSTIINANAQENTDLFWALKGGGANFGIVTKIEMTTVPNKVWCAARVFSPTEYDSLVAALMQYHANIETDNQATLIWHGTSDAILHVYVYCSPVEDPDVFAPFFDVPFLQTPVAPGLRTILELMYAIKHFVPEEDMFHDFRTMSSLPSPSIYKAAEKARLEQTLALSAAGSTDFVLTNVFQPMSSLAMKKSADSPLGLEPVGQQWFLTMGDFKHAADEARMREASKKIVDAAEDAAKKEGLLLEYKYVNYAARDQNALAGYGPSNLERLWGVARKYDPEGVFQRLQGGGWLLSKVGKV
ncbi:hypothetical protein BDV19DRAFT_397325 [Aspergillus venezuelensis]